MPNPLQHCFQADSIHLVQNGKIEGKSKGEVAGNSICIRILEEKEKILSYFHIR
jgi:hypothetical protein